MARKNQRPPARSSSGAKGSADVRTLNADEVASIHAALVQDFAEHHDPISPPGIKSTHLLESAVSRQLTGFGGDLKYNTPYLNAAALTYGICSNHPFHNGNKRVSLVAMLCHLQKNELVFQEGVSHDELYKFMLSVASHEFRLVIGKRDQSDHEVNEMSAWIRARTRRIERGEKIITFRELRGILGSFGFYLTNFRDNHCDVMRDERDRLWFGLAELVKGKRYMRMGYPSDGAVVGMGLIRDLRARCCLTDQDGVDSQAFYSTKAITPDAFVAKYRNTLKRLARV